MDNINNFLEKKRRLKDEEYIEMALGVATQARSNGEVPIAAVLVWSDGQYLIEHDTRYGDHNVLNHAIINVINKASETLVRKRLGDATIYSTIEPDAFCALAIKAAGIKEVVFGAYDDKDGYISSQLLADHTILDLTVIGGVLGEKCCQSLPKSMQEHVRH